MRVKDVKKVIDDLIFQRKFGGPKIDYNSIALILEFARENPNIPLPIFTVCPGGIFHLHYRKYKSNTMYGFSYLIVRYIHMVYFLNKKIRFFRLTKVEDISDKYWEWNDERSKD